MPISTVVSESAFSTSGWVIDKFRSSLTPKSAEALICTQDWLRSTPADVEDMQVNGQQLEDLVENLAKIELAQTYYWVQAQNYKMANVVRLKTVKPNFENRKPTKPAKPETVKTTWFRFLILQKPHGRDDTNTLPSSGTITFPASSTGGGDSRLWYSWYSGGAKVGCFGARHHESSAYGSYGKSDEAMKCYSCCSNRILCLLNDNVDMEVVVGVD
ncbi:zinc finger, BED-type [Artemisia annua]|uniref:Zinc finger, BED-type n=1 Tax=Artemisia annua TaxID=35608 RepID=A0A2U1NUL8_ARTAN|nr:zinc finger, BED-type [Artemisia annua]